MEIGYANPYTVAAAQPTERATFIRKTYLHLALAVLAFVGLEYYLVHSTWAVALAGKMLSISWLLVLAAFMGVSWIANRWALSGGSRAKQYLGLGLFVVAEAFIFLPLILIAITPGVGAADALPKAAIVTGFLFAALTAVAFITRTDFSFLGTGLAIGGMVAMGIIVVGILFGFNLGTWFAGGMVLFASASILYTTSRIIHQYRPDQHVAAALGLFAGVALLFWYVLQLFMSRD